MIYLYDGTFYGLLTCIYEHYYVEKVAEIFSEENFLGSIIDETKFIKVNEDKAIKVEKAIRDKFTLIGYMDMYRSFLSNEVNKDCYILAYVIHGFKMGATMDRLFSEPYVINIRKMSKRVGFEVLRFEGLLRFVEKPPFLYSAFEPDNDILPLIAEHFADRYLNEQIIIHDIKRKKAVVAYEGKWLIYDIDNNHELNKFNDKDISDNEALLQKLWRGYFEHIGISGRKNLKLQQSFVPLKYRKHILEFTSVREKNASSVEEVLVKTNIE